MKREARERKPASYAALDDLGHLRGNADPDRVADDTSSQPASSSFRATRATAAGGTGPS